MSSANHTEIDKKWIHLLKKGERNALTEVFNHYHSRLYAFAFSFVKSKDLADEIVQDTFLKIWQRKDSISTDYSFSSFIFRIAKNLAIDNLRKAVREEAFKSELAAKILTFHTEPEEELLYTELSETILACIDQLPEQRQKIFRLSREENLSHEEISIKLGISKNTVKVSIFKSLKEIKNQLAKSGIYLIVISMFLKG